MKKNAWIVVLVFTLLVVGRAQVPPQQQMKLEDVQKALSLVDKPQPVPDKYKAGFEAITAKDTLAMLTFIASDLDGRPRDRHPRLRHSPPSTPPRCFKMWGVKPAGDMPSFGAASGMGGGQPPAPADPAASGPISRNSA